MSGFTVQELNAMISVGIGDYKVTNGVRKLITRDLGSCVGIAMGDPLTGIGGLLHIMLPHYIQGGFDDMAHGGFVNLARYADAGLDELVNALLLRGADRHRLMAKIAGGAHMISVIDGDESHDISSKNVEAVKAKLWQLGIPLLAEDTGGHNPRTLVFDTATGELRIITVTPTGVTERVV